MGDKLGLDGIVPVTPDWAGQTAVIFGCGPSFTVVDSGLCHRYGLRTIGINESGIFVPVDVLYAGDKTFWNRYPQAQVFRGPKYSASAGCEMWGVKRLPLTGDTGIELDSRGLRGGKNGGYQAINLAVHLGVKRILLLGYDMSFEHGVHWFDRKPVLSGRFLIDRLPAYFDTMVEPLKILGVEVINCTPRTVLRSFPIRALREVLNEEISVPVNGCVVPFPRSY